MFKAIIVPALLSVLGAIFLLACIGEKEYRNKIFYAVVAGVVLVMLLISVTL